MNDICSSYSSVMDLDHRYTSVSVEAALKSGFRNPAEMLGTTVFDLRSRVVAIADQVFRVNRKVIDSAKQILTLDICYYLDGLECYLTRKYPQRNASNNLCGVCTDATRLTEACVSPFVLSLYKYAAYLGKLDKFNGIYYEIVKAYEEHGLTVQESKVLFLVVYGKSMTKIADILSISARTVEFHISGIKQKLALRTKAQMIQYAMHVGIVNQIPLGLVIN